MVLSGDDAITEVRRVVGSTANPEPGTIRYEFGVHNERTLVHASDSLEAFEFELDVVIKALGHKPGKERRV
jgi:nucleoside-diphosphate kinase